LGGETDGGLPGEVGVGVGGKENGRRGEFLEQKGFFGSVRASESEEGVGSATEMLSNPRRGETVQSLKFGTV
jgi:hypothetical protein